MLAAMAGDVPIVHSLIQLLMQHGANVNRVANNGMTALMVAIRMGHVGVAELLIEKGAEVNQEDGTGKTCLSIVSRDDPAICRLLVLAGADQNLVALDDRPACVGSIISPLELIQKSDLRRQNFDEILASITPQSNYPKSKHLSC